MAAGHLVTHRDDSFRRNVDLDHLQHAATKFVTALHAVQLAIADVECRFDVRPVRLVNASRCLFLRSSLRILASDGSQTKLLSSFGDVLGILSLGQWRAVIVGQRATESAFHLRQS